MTNKSGKSEQAAKAAAFLARHHSRPVLLLPNAWDAMSAGIFAAAGFPAVATTSGGVAWALGYPDGEQAPWDEVVASTARIVRAAGIPVTADIEAGYGDTPSEVAAHVREIVETGVVGINLEDGVHGHLRSPEDAWARIRGARDAADAAGVPIVINARCDVFHVAAGDEKQQFEEAVRRSRLYLSAGAQCVYPFGLRNPATIAEFVRAIAAPVNVTGRPGLPDTATLEKIGVARVTIASAAALVVMSTIERLAADLRDTGNFDALAAPFRRPDAQKLFHRKD